MRFKLACRHALVLPCTKFGKDTLTISSYIEWKPSFICRGLNDLCDLKNKVKVTRFKLGLRFALVLLGTKFGEDT